MRPLIQSDLDSAALKGCQNPNCQHKEAHVENVVFLRCPICIDGEDLELSYKLLSGIIVVGCQNCGNPIAFIKVACCL
jgi:hypothetical protein